MSENSFYSQLQPVDADPKGFDPHARTRQVTDAVEAAVDELAHNDSAVKALAMIHKEIDPLTAGEVRKMAESDPSVIKIREVADPAHQGKSCIDFLGVVPPSGRSWDIYYPPQELKCD